MERRGSEPGHGGADSRQQTADGAVRKRLDGNHETMRREESSTCQPDAQADYSESLCISQTVESSILTALWGGKEGKGERRMCCDAGAEAVLKITAHTHVSHPRAGYLPRPPGL